MIQHEEAVMEMKERLAKAEVKDRACTSILLDDFHEEYQHQTLQQGQEHIKEEVDIRKLDFSVNPIVLKFFILNPIPAFKKFN